MRTNRMIAVVLLILIPLLPLFAGGGQEEPGSEELVKLTWHQIGNPQPELPVVMEEVNRYLAEKIGVELDIVVHGWGDYNTAMQTMHAAGEPFDLCFTAPWTNAFIATASKGAYLPIDDLLQSYGQDILATLDPSYWEAAKIDGKTYAIVNLQIMSNQRGIAVVKEYADKYGFDPADLETNEDLFDFFEAVKENEPGVIPFFGIKEGIGPDLNADTSFYYDFVLGENSGYIGVRMNDESKSVIDVVTSPEYRRDVESVRTMLAEGYLPPDFAALELDEEVRGKDYASFLMYRIKPGVEGENLVRYGKETIVFGLHRPYTSTASVSSTMTAIGVNSAHPEKAMELYNLVYSDKYLYNLLVFGIEGVHYTLGDDGYVTQNADRAYGLPAWQFGNQFNAYLMPGQDADVWDQTIALDESADASPILGFVFDPAPVRNEVAACNAINDEYRVAVFYAEDLDAALEEFNNALVDAGLNRIIAEAQNQVAAWAAGM